LGGVAIPLLVADIAHRAAIVLLILILFVPIAWFVVLAGDERASIKGRLGWAGGQ